MARREYKGAATPTTIVNPITNSDVSITLTNATGWPTGSFSLVIDPGLAGEEKILATSRTGTTVNLTTRGYDNTTAAAHVAGAIIYPVPTAIDFDEANAHTTSSSGVHGLTGSVIGTTDTQTLTNKDLTSGTNTFPTSLATLTGTQTLTNKTLKTAREYTTVSATAATGTINFDAVTQGVLVYTTSASANWTLNVRGDGSTTLNTLMAIGETLTVTFIATQGSTAYYASAFTIDGTSVTPKWQGGTAPSAGNASSDDAYTYAIVKTASATYRVYASQTKFA